MRHLCTSCEDETQLASFLSDEATLSALAGARSVLVQVFAGDGDLGPLRGIVALLVDRLPAAVVTGCSSSGEICDGRVGRRTLVISIAIFYTSELHPLLLPCRRGEEFDAGLTIGRHCAGLSDPRGLLLLVPSLQIDSSRLLEGLASQPSLPTVFGGAAAALGGEQQAFVILGDSIREDAVVAVALCGAALRVQCLTSFALKPLGPPLLLTRVDGSNVYGIDDKPAPDVYRRYLGANHDHELFLLEFPMLVQRAGRLFARNPLAINADGSLALIADLREGEKVRLGYIDVDLVIDTAMRYRTQLGEFGAEGVFIYSCVCRRFTLQDDTEAETLLFQDIAPTAGFFTYGEFAQAGGRPVLHNSTEIVVGLCEGESRRRPPAPIHTLPGVDDRYRLRHIQLTSRLFNFIAALTEELNAANRSLRHLAERDALTGVLNRRMFDWRLAAEIARSNRYGDSLSIALLDIDHFKTVNDTFGHLVGDRILVSVARRVEAAMREADAFFRYGGEEFAIVMPGTGLAEALVAAERIRRMIAALEICRDDGEALPAVTASVGVATHPVHGADCTTLLNAADAALYGAKSDGRNRVMAAQPPHHAAAEPVR
jgi:diguanylate cyclase (GGDEF) domain